MKVRLVMRIRDTRYMGETLSREDIAFPVLPNVGDGVVWNGDWGVETCVYRYIGPDEVEIGLSTCAGSDVNDLIAAGWVLR